MTPGQLTRAWNRNPWKVWRISTSLLNWSRTWYFHGGEVDAVGQSLPQCLSDVAVGFTGMDFETAVRERISILSILVNIVLMHCEIPLMPLSASNFEKP